VPTHAVHYEEYAVGFVDVGAVLIARALEAMSLAMPQRQETDAARVMRGPSGWRWLARGRTGEADDKGDVPAV